MARLVQSPRKRRPSLSSEASSSSTSSLIVIRRPHERTASTFSARSISTNTVGKARLVDVPAPLNIDKSRRTTRRSIAGIDSNTTSMMDVDRPGSRNMSGETLVSRSISVVKEKEQELLTEGIKALDMDWSVEELEDPVLREDGEVENGKKRRSTRLSLLTNAVASTATALGKRTRNVFETSKEKMQEITTNANKRSSLRPRTSQSMGTMPEMGQVEEEEPPRKKTKVTTVQSAPNLLTIAETTVVKKPQSKSAKKWLSSGLYIGQQRWFNPKVNGARNRKAMGKRMSDGAPPAEKQMLPMPMFTGERLLEVGRDFRLPFDVFSPLPPGQPRPDDWKKTSYNRFVGDAATEWRYHKPLGHARCLCTPEDGCGEDCHNRYMFYECDDDNCNIGADACKNRSFAELMRRCKSGNKYDIGVELTKTIDRGFGVRACRTFAPNQIIVEYAGEIITQEECERRMQEEYKDNECYYLMAFDQNMIIDATRGSIARFANHACEPNCRMVKWTVAGKPRMALFAGDDGIMTGEELTYDYNFDPFSAKNAQVCRCGAPSCRGFLGPRPNQYKERERERERERQEEAAKPRRKSAGPALSTTATKRKVETMLKDANLATHTNRSTSSLLAKRRRATTDAIPSISSSPVTQKPQKRIVSSASTLVEKENLKPSKAVSHASLSRTPSSESKYRVTKRSSPLVKGQSGRRTTVNALSRVASVLKRNASTLKRKVAQRKSTGLAARRGGVVSPIAKNEGVNDGDIGAGVARPGTVQSVRGERRAEAMRKMGIGRGIGSVKMGKSMRIVEE